MYRRNCSVDSTTIRRGRGRFPRSPGPRGDSPWPRPVSRRRFCLRWAFEVTYQGYGSDLVVLGEFADRTPRSSPDHHAVGTAVSRANRGHTCRALQHQLLLQPPRSVEVTDAHIAGASATSPMRGVDEATGGGVPGNASRRNWRSVDDDKVDMGRGAHPSGVEHAPERAQVSRLCRAEAGVGI